MVQMSQVFEQDGRRAGPKPVSVLSRKFDLRCGAVNRRAHAA